MPVWVSVGGFEADDYAEICSRLDDHAEVSAIELNVSCPNVEAPAESAAQIVAASRLATRKPLWAKLSPAVPDIAEVARAAQAAGADGLSLVNTIRGLKLDERTLGPFSARAGRPLRSRAEADRACSRRQLLPRDAAPDRRDGRRPDRSRRTGAHRGRRPHVALGTILFADPDAPARVRAELHAAAAEHGWRTYEDAYAVAHEEALSVGTTLDTSRACKSQKTCTEP